MTTTSASSSMETFRDDLYQGQVVLVTGGGTGICRSITEAFMRHGADTVICSRRIAVLESAAEEMSKATGRRCLPVQCDVRNMEDIERVFDAALAEFGRVDVVVNGAAGNFLCPASKLSANAYRRVMEIDTFGTFNTSKAAFEKWFKENGGIIINISMTLHYTGTPLQAHAASAKAANDACALVLANEWGPKGIRVNSLAPGPIADTEGLSRLLPDGKRRMFEKGIPLQRMGEKEEIANAALFLASPAASYITGTTLVVDGGAWMLGNGPMMLAKM